MEARRILESLKPVTTNSARTASMNGERRFSAYYFKLSLVQSVESPVRTSFSHTGNSKEKREGSLLRRAREKLALPTAEDSTEAMVIAS